MGLIRDTLGERLADKSAIVQQNLNAVSVPNVPFKDVVMEVDDADVLAAMVAGTQQLDDNLANGTAQWLKFNPHFVGWVNHLSSLGLSYDSYLTSRHWRIHQLATILLEGASRNISRKNTFAPRTALMAFENAGAAVAGVDIPSDCGPAPLCAAAVVKGAVDWTPEMTVVHEGPAGSVYQAITDAALTLNVTDEADFPAAGLPGTPFLIMVNNECLQVTDTDGGGAPAAWTVVRARKGTAAAAHAASTPIYFVSDEAGAMIPAACNVGGEFPVRRLPITTLSLSEQAVVAATGIGGTDDFALDNMYVLIRDRTCPQKLTADCATAAQATVEDASVFYPGDYCIIDEDIVAAELVTVRDTDKDTNVVYFDAAVAGTFTQAQNAVLYLAHAFINEGAAFAAGDVTLTVTDVTMLPTIFPFSIMIDDEIFSATANPAGNDLTVVRGTQGTIDVEHADGSPVILCPTDFNVDAPRFNRAVERGNQEWGIIATAGANQVTMAHNLIHSYGLAGYVEPLLRDCILVVDGAGGSAGDILDVVTRPDAVIARAD